MWKQTACNIIQCTLIAKWYKNEKGKPDHSSLISLIIYEIGLTRWNGRCRRLLWEGRSSLVQGRLMGVGWGEPSQSVLLLWCSHMECLLLQPVCLGWGIGPVTPFFCVSRGKGQLCKLVRDFPVAISFGGALATEGERHMLTVWRVNTTFFQIKASGRKWESGGLMQEICDFARDEGMQGFQQLFCWDSHWPVRKVFGLYPWWWHFFSQGSVCLAIIHWLLWYLFANWKLGYLSISVWVKLAKGIKNLNMCVCGG